MTSRYPTRLKASQNTPLHPNKLSSPNIIIKKPSVRNIKNPEPNSTICESLSASIQHHLSQKNLSSAAILTRQLISLSLNPSQTKQHIFSLSQILFDMNQMLECFDLIIHHKIHSTNVNALHLATKCMIQLKKYKEAQELLNENESLVIKSQNKGVHYYLKGLCYLKQCNNVYAKKYLSQALMFDVTLVDAFIQLSQSNLLTFHQELKLIESLPFCQQVGEGNAEFYQLFYKSQMTSLSDPLLTLPAITQLESKYLTPNIDILISKARSFLFISNYTTAFDIVKDILKSNGYVMECIDIQVSCMYHQKKKNELFLLSHDLVNKFPEHYVSWYSLGCYFLLVQKYEASRKHFAKCTTIEPHWGPGWIGFGHSISGQGEYEQSIIAYGTASKYMPESHLPCMFIASQYLHNYQLEHASRFLSLANECCDWDPHLLNENGVLKFRKGDYDTSITYFESVLDRISNTITPTWIHVLNNLAHAYLRKGNYIKSKQLFHQVLNLDVGYNGAYAGLALVHHLERLYDQAIQYYHHAISLHHNDSFCNEMLEICLKESLQNNEPIKPKRGIPSKGGFSLLNLPFELSEFNEMDLVDRWVPKKISDRVLVRKGDVVMESCSDLDMD